MRKLAALISLIFAICMVPTEAKALLELTSADWLAAAEAALKLSSRSAQITLVVNDDLPSEARNALQGLRKGVALIDVPEPNMEGQVPSFDSKIAFFSLRLTVARDRPRLDNRLSLLMPMRDDRMPMIDAGTPFRIMAIRDCGSTR
jgi:hypothetical protein